ncbi:carbon storage regulator CsrA [Lysinibacillus capsici]|uniref:Translational regulator CsrA n=1 Tax=Lysinibacillus capsici TaxID=2115968 RepID=A0ABY8KDT2_9BACI|nr:carbon storage regulator CsrA [Lysinibacillus capsici]MDP1393432.1 carbon storage regulator CsrA [Lysinibacillus capsici]MDP1413906.1 carbon storage regulator CsrA [Lysinibacillus capsici]MDP1429156.1 carbon storage regulator CsrA [Lysinibacillus capsici]WGF37659.1 carbon storage regulator CsrA [Lysinibacillus capsici]
MLVLSRKKNESIMIGDQIEIKILAVEGEQIKLGIIAPKAVTIHRKEIFEDIQRQNKEALVLNVDLLDQLKKYK